MRGEIQGDVGEALETLSGKMFVELDYADLAGWQRWIDYPVELPNGRGALRVWGDLKKGDSQVTADLALEEVSIRLGEKLPLLNLDNMRGRLEGNISQASGQLLDTKVEFLTLDGIRMVPTDFLVDWHADAQTAGELAELEQISSTSLP